MENNIEQFSKSMIARYEQEKAQKFSILQKNQISTENQVISKLNKIESTLKEQSNLMKEQNNLLKELISTLNKLTLDGYNEDPLPKIIHF